MCSAEELAKEGQRKSILACWSALFLDLKIGLTKKLGRFTNSKTNEILFFIMKTVQLSQTQAKLNIPVGFPPEAFEQLEF